MIKSYNKFINEEVFNVEYEFAASLGAKTNKELIENLQANMQSFRAFQYISKDDFKNRIKTIEMDQSVPLTTFPI